MSSFIKTIGSTSFLCIPNVALINFENITTINLVGAESYDPECTYIESILIKTQERCFLISDQKCMFELSKKHHINAHINQELMRFLMELIG